MNRKLSPTKHRLVASICKMVEQKLSIKDILDLTQSHTTILTFCSTGPMTT